MQHQRDVMMVCLFDRNEALMHSLISESAPRVAAMGTENTRSCVQQILNKSVSSVEECTVVFLSMLSRDTELKKKTIDGIPRQLLHGMSKEKQLGSTCTSTAKYFYHGYATSLAQPPRCWTSAGRCTCFRRQITLRYCELSFQQINNVYKSMNSYLAQYTCIIRLMQTVPD